jgi:hypothetical protein
VHSTCEQTLIFDKSDVTSTGATGAATGASAIPSVPTLEQAEVEEDHEVQATPSPQVRGASAAEASLSRPRPATCAEHWQMTAEKSTAAWSSKASSTTSDSKARVATSDSKARVATSSSSGAQLHHSCDSLAAPETS